MYPGARHQTEASAMGGRRPFRMDAACWRGPASSSTSPGHGAIWAYPAGGGGPEIDMESRRPEESSFRDWAAERTNTPREVVEAALAHTVQNPTEAAYARSDLFERRRRLMDDWAEYLSGARGQGTSSRSAITRCFCSMTTATAWPQSCGRATSPARTTGRNCSYPRSIASRRVGCGWRSAPTPPSQGRRSTRRWGHAASSTPFASRPTKTWSWRSRTSCFGRGVGPVARRSSATRASPIRRTAGPRLDGSWQKSSTTSASCSRASASLSRISGCPIARSYGSTTSGFDA